MACLSGIIMASATAALILMDISYSHVDRVIVHLILGGIVTFLFFTLCSRGYEAVNWGFLLISPIYIISYILFLTLTSIPLSPSRDQECDICKRPRHFCSCMRPDSFSEPKPIHSCPGNPSTLSTKCGMSRYT
jgi:hypothetical protein